MKKLCTPECILFILSKLNIIPIFAPKCHASEHFLLPISKMLNIFRKRRKNCICRRNLAGESQMCVDIGCGADVTMPQPFLNFFQAHTIGVQQAGTTVPKIMKSYLFSLFFARRISKCWVTKLGFISSPMEFTLM